MSPGSSSRVCGDDGGTNDDSSCSIGFWRHPNHNALQSKFHLLGHADKRRLRSVRATPTDEIIRLAPI
jgi:hypothetical protein